MTKESPANKESKNPSPPQKPQNFFSEEEEFEYFKNLALYWEKYAHELEAKIAEKKRIARLKLAGEKNSC